MNILRQYKIYKLTGILPLSKEYECIMFLENIMNDLIVIKDKTPTDIYYVNNKYEWMFQQDNKRNIYQNILLSNNSNTV